LESRDCEGIMAKHRNELKCLNTALNNGGDTEKGVDGTRMGSYKLTKIRNQVPESVWRGLDQND
jgi:hypothetical protein